MWKLKPMLSPFSSRRTLSQPSENTWRSLFTSSLQSLTIIVTPLSGRGCGAVGGGERLRQDIEPRVELRNLDGQRGQHLDHLAVRTGGFDDQALLEAGGADGRGGLPPAHADAPSSAERGVGEECVRTGRSRGAGDTE